MLSWTALIQECEADLLNGDTKKVSARLSALNHAKVPRKFRHSVANLSYRSGNDSLGLKLLTPLMLNEGGANADPPTAQELSEYAMLLRRAGAVQESRTILSKLNHDEHPVSLLYLAFCHFNLWDYESAIPILKKYIAYPMLEYPRVVAQVNLAASYVSTENFREAMDLLGDIIGNSRTREFWRLECNGLELRAQIHMQEGRLAEAKADLQLASQRLGQANIPDQLFVQKWLAVIAGLESGDPAGLLAFKRQALERRHWESAREADLYSLKIRFDAGSFNYLYFGTPVDSYRRRIVSQLKFTPTASHYIFGDANAKPCLDLESGLVPGHEPLIPGGQLHQALNALLADFYRPRLLGGLFSDLFPGEQFNVFSSPDRVHQCLRRVRRWMESVRIPAGIKGAKGRFSLELKDGFSLRLPLDRRPQRRELVQLAALRAVFGSDRTFSKAQGMQVTGLSAEAFKNLCSWAVDERLLLRFGAGPATVYQLEEALRISAAG